MCSGGEQGRPGGGQEERAGGGHDDGGQAQNRPFPDLCPGWGEYRRHVRKFSPGIVDQLGDRPGESEETAHLQGVPGEDDDDVGDLIIGQEYFSHPLRKF